MKNTMILVLALLMAGMSNVNGQEISLTYSRSLYEKAVAVSYPASKLLTSSDDPGRMLIEHVNTWVLVLRYFDSLGNEEFDVQCGKTDTSSTFGVINNPDSLDTVEITYILKKFLYLIQETEIKIKTNINYHKEDSLSNQQPLISSDSGKSTNLQSLLMRKMGSRKSGNMEFRVNFHDKIIMPILIGAGGDGSIPCFYYRDGKRICDFLIYGLPHDKEIKYYITNKGPDITYEEMNKILLKWIETIK